MKARHPSTVRCHTDIVGLDISDERFFAAHFSPGRGGQRLDRIAVGDFPPSLSERKMAARLRAFWKQEKLPSRTVRTCLRSRALVIRFFSYKNLTADELPATLSLEAEEALQLPASAICMDWHLHPSAPESGGVQAGMLIAAPRESVERHLRLLTNAGLYAVRVETGCSALMNFLNFVDPEQAPETLCLINLSARTADLVIRAGERCYARSLFSADCRWEDNAGFLMENIQNALLYYHLKLKGNAVDRLQVIGRIPDPASFADRLQRTVSLPVELLQIDNQPWVNARLKAPYTWTSCSPAAAIGLAINGSGHAAD